MQAPLETPRLDLRPFRAEDVEGWHAIWGDPSVIAWGAFESFEASRLAFLRLVAHEPQWPEGIGWLAVREKGSAAIVGDVMLQPAPFVDGVEAGWHFLPHVWNRGYATEAAEAMVARGFAEGIYERVYAAVGEQNPASARVAEKLGMRALDPIELDGLPHRLYVRP